MLQDGLFITLCPHLEEGCHISFVQVSLECSFMLLVVLVHDRMQLTAEGVEGLLCVVGSGWLLGLCVVWC